MNRMGGILAGLGYSTIFGFSFLMTKEALEVLSPMELLAMRFVIAALLMSILAIAGIIQLNFKGSLLRF